MNWWQDKLMFALIGNTIIYNVSWEDPRLDCEMLDLHAKDTILMLTSGGCNVLDMVLEGPARVVAADLNPRQNALLELKVTAIKYLTHEEFFQLFAASNGPLFRELYRSRLRDHLSPFARAFWDENGTGFFRSVMWSGASGWAAWMLLQICRFMGLGPLIDEVRTCATLDAQRAVYNKYLPRVVRLANIINYTRRIWCPFIAVPASQLNLFEGNIVRLACDNLFLRTHISRDNYHYYGYMYGCYSRECCPRYLKPENFEFLKANVHKIDIRTGTLQDVASGYEDGFFSRYILLDHMDWMPMSMVLDEWSVFVRKASADCRILWRSFSSHQHIAPLKYLTFHPENVRAALAMYPDRVFMYNSTHLATINPEVTIVPRTVFRPRGTVCDDLNVLYHNWFHGISGTDQKARLTSFYEGQARSYDAFRYRFLHGRVPMVEAMPTPAGGVWVDFGGGTASNLEFLGDNLRTFKKVVIFDLCRPLLDVAAKRVEANPAWKGIVELVEGDATAPVVPGLPAHGTVDLVTFSYSLTMIPDWRAALRNAYALLRPGGYIAVSDFTVRPENSWITRILWPYIFAKDNVYPREAHVDALETMFQTVHYKLEKGGFPYVPFLKSPYYYFVGQKRAGINHHTATAS